MEDKWIKRYPIQEIPATLVEKCVLCGNIILFSWCKDIYVNLTPGGSAGKYKLFLTPYSETGNFLHMWGQEIGKSER